jgi:hypothetical protein
MNNVLSLNPAALLTSRSMVIINKKFFAVIIFFSLLSLLFLYIFQINSLVSSSYSLQSLQKNIDGLNQDNENLEISLAGTGALDSIESKISGLGFKKITKINYIQIMETSVASAK